MTFCWSTDKTPLHIPLVYDAPALNAVIIVAWPADARDVTCSDVTQGNDDGMATSINVGIDPLFATKYGRHFCTSHLYFVYFYCTIADQYSSASVTDWPVLPSSVQPFAQWSSFLSGFKFLCCIGYQACGCLYCVFAVTCYLFMYLHIIALCGRCEWHYISGECLTTDLVTLSRV
jgi:hypothetical protein